ncbi:hypothetical protein [Plantactinospora endophytica]|uniref:Uncharacterized protein n=1 Tax=Plantactinospora endophytica TaxID=673535 RepID=A0ABQ4EE60_9ACTN|nr:hypothetical protein [Plantactinospora endophytica]GIG93009.1 hypothetical protein Pen02_79450 [Plantactinospora endophytica]
MRSDAPHGRRIGLLTDTLGATPAEQPATDLIRRAAADLPPRAPRWSRVDFVPIT